MLEPTPDRDGTVAVVVEPRRRRGAAIVGIAAAAFVAVALVGSGVAATATSTKALGTQTVAFGTVLIQAGTGVAGGTTTIGTVPGEPGQPGSITTREVTVSNAGTLQIDALTLGVTTSSDPFVGTRFQNSDSATALTVRVAVCDVPFVAGVCEGAAFLALPWTPFVTASPTIGLGGAWLTVPGDQAEIQVSIKEPQVDANSVDYDVSFSLTGMSYASTT